MSDELTDEPGFPYLAFCPIAVYDPAHHDPVNCPYCGNDNLANGELIQTIYIPKNELLECRCIYGCIVKFLVVPYVATPKAIGECEHFRYVMLLENEAK